MSSTAPVSANGFSARSVLRKALIATVVLAVVIAAVGGVIGFLTVGTDGLWSALIGTALAVVFALITVVSLLVALRYTLNAFFGIIMGAWLLKAVLFIVLLSVVRDLPFVHPMVLFLSLVTAIVGTLVIDVIVVLSSRQSYASDVTLPGSERDAHDSTP